MMQQRSGRQGFTLVELIVVIVLTGILGGGMVMFFKPAIQNYLAVEKRASLTNMADGAMRLITTEVRSAVPNSLRVTGTDCVELVPTSDGGRFRIAPDTAWDLANAATPSAYLDMSDVKIAFDVLTPFSTMPAADDWVVIGNQTASDVYTGKNRAAIASVSAAPDASLGRHRIKLKTATQFPLGYEGGSFVIVPNAKQAVTYRCVNPGLNAGTGTGTGTLYRMSRYGFNTAQGCPAAPPATTPIVASKLTTCVFSYNPHEGATQQSGFLEVRLGLSDAEESATLVFSVHVDNAP